MKIINRTLKGIKLLGQRARPYSSINLITLFDKEKYIVDQEHVFATIGRNETNTIILPDERVSRLHCRIDFEAGKGLQITDYSKNGTWITDPDIKSTIHLINKSGWFQINQGFIFLGLPPSAGFNMTRIQFFCS